MRVSFPRLPGTLSQLNSLNDATTIIYYCDDVCRIVLKESRSSGKNLVNSRLCTFQTAFVLNVMPFLKRIASIILTIVWNFRSQVTKLESVRSKAEKVTTFT